MPWTDVSWGAGDTFVGAETKLDNMQGNMDYCYDELGKGRVIFLDSDWGSYVYLALAPPSESDFTGFGIRIENATGSVTYGSDSNTTSPRSWHDFEILNMTGFTVGQNIVIAYTGQVEGGSWFDLPVRIGFRAADEDIGGKYSLFCRMRVSPNRDNGYESGADWMIEWYGLSVLQHSETWS